jgi:hypothetical protein
MKITVNQIMKWGPCWYYPRAVVEKLWKDNEYLSLHEIAELEISCFDLWWVCTHVMNRKQQEHMKNWCILQILPDDVPSIVRDYFQCPKYSNREKVKNIVFSNRIRNDRWLTIYQIFICNDSIWTAGINTAKINGWNPLLDYTLEYLEDDNDQSSEKANCICIKCNGRIGEYAESETVTRLDGVQYLAHKKCKSDRF